MCKYLTFDDKKVIILIKSGITCMNRKIYNHLVAKLKESFKLPRYDTVRAAIAESTVVSDMPWTPKRLERFKDDLVKTFDFEPSLAGSLSDITSHIDEEYSARFWGGGIWQPRTDVYQYTGWGIVDEINKRNPKAVLDVGCGYNQFKPRIPNLIGIDKYNNSADYMVDILEYTVDPESYDAIIVFGSINFGEYSDIEARMKRVFDLTAPGGRIYMRANPGESHKHGPWIDIFPWNFDTAHRLAKENGMTLVTLKKDNNNRLVMVYEK